MNQEISPKALAIGAVVVLLLGIAAFFWFNRQPGPESIDWSTTVLPPPRNTSVPGAPTYGTPPQGGTTQPGR